MKVQQLQIRKAQSVFPIGADTDHVPLGDGVNQKVDSSEYYPETEKPGPAHFRPLTELQPSQPGKDRCDRKRTRENENCGQPMKILHQLENRIRSPTRKYQQK
jgi:hypothetical protein